MYAQVEKSKENKSRAVANSIAQKKNNGKQGFGVVENRPSAQDQRYLKTNIADSSGMVAQRQQVQAIQSSTVRASEFKNESIQRKPEVAQFWWPLGHRTISEKAFNLYPGKERYTEEARQYLIDRSPDMDFLQDETNAMEGGIATGKANIERMKELVKGAPEDVANATRMWNNNDLHIRPGWYSAHHGEGGRYKTDETTGASINETVTEKMLNVAVSKYKAQAREPGLSVLSDALHQTEDRGAHMEGEAFKGHDSRMTVRKKERPLAGDNAIDLSYKKDTSYTDNAAENPEGAKKAVVLAINLYTKFADRVLDDETETAISKGEGEQTRVRHSKFAARRGTTASSGGLKAKLLGKTGSKIIKGLPDTDWWHDYTLPETRALETPEELYAEGAVERYQEVWIIGELTERIREKDGWGSEQNFESRKARARAELNEMVSKDWLPDVSPTEDQKDRWVEQAVHQFQYQRMRGDKQKGAVLSDPLVPKLELSIEWLESHLEGLIGLTSGGGAWVQAEELIREDQDKLARWKGVLASAKYDETMLSGAASSSNYRAIKTEG